MTSITLAGTVLSLSLVALILCATWLTNFLFGRLIIGAVWKRNRSLAYEVSSVGGIIIWTAGVLLTLPVLGASDTVVSVAILLVGVFLILATRDFTGNWFAGQTIKKIAPFKIGDWIRTPSTYGRVVKIDDLYTTLITPENESVAIPNSRLTSDFVVDRSGNGPIKVPLEIDVPPDLGVSTVSISLAEIARELSTKFSDLGENEQPEIYVISQSTRAVRVRVMLRITNPANEEEAKSEFNKRLAALHWSEPLAPPP
ncbi:MAG TPA: mechanosensitive ion channel family protein [Nitrososphaerales archaeon]|nr:mechanosensitive ion channel family protein [Nitrososphaerales archaeon]